MSRGSHANAADHHCYLNSDEISLAEQSRGTSTETVLERPEMVGVVDVGDVFM